MKEFTLTLRMFMENYNEFDWEQGKIIIVNGHTPHICTGQRAFWIDRFKNRGVINWTHDEDTIVITI